MTEDDDDFGGYDVDDWRRLTAFAGRIAVLDDVEAKAAIFALSDTLNGKPLSMELPQPVIWWGDDGEQAAVAVQAEQHDSEEGETMQVLGLILPDGSSAVALLDDVDLVNDTDPTWVQLVVDAIGDETA